MAAAASAWVPDRRDIIWIDFNPQAGREMRDLHPMMVLSPKAFNDRTSIVIGLPMTTAESNESNPFAIRFREEINFFLFHFSKPNNFRLWRICANFF